MMSHCRSTFGITMPTVTMTVTVTPLYFGATRTALTLCLLLLSHLGTVAVWGQYIYYPYAPNALYQQGMNVSFVSGLFQNYQEQAGFGSSGVYNGAFGVTFDRTEQYLFVTSADGKKIRKLNYRTTYVGSDITRKYCTVLHCTAL